MNLLTLALLIYILPTSRPRPKVEPTPPARKPSRRATNPERARNPLRAVL